MRSTLLRRFDVALLGSMLAFAAACGGANPTPTAPSAGAPSAAAAPEAPVNVPATWSADMPKEQQAAFMKKNVLPAMGPVFQGHDATKYADFGCKTCHGHPFKNPHDALPHLTFKDGKLTCFAEKPEMAKFMAEQVAPKMAAAMGLPHYDPATGKGFGCGGCHTVDKP